MSIEDTPDIASYEPAPDTVPAGLPPHEFEQSVRPPFDPNELVYVNGRVRRAGEIGRRALRQVSPDGR